VRLATISPLESGIPRLNRRGSRQGTLKLTFAVAASFWDVIIE
jgi:hypothetical protein